MDESTRLSRRTFLGGMAVAAFAGTIASPALAETKASQASMRYQNTPNGSMHCSLCRFFIPGRDAEANGSCQLVEGSISPNGYCIAFAAKSE
ncbi:MAG: twin-arginine translocation signal domain-containing protein [Candidatus Eremiobacteraeota bacterium]|nr:twin-arginine translocation signal domain-containing protein [Candidatus Eremiobacteraeota bacterium]